MTRIELSINTTEWQIEDSEKEVERLRKKIEDSVSKDFFRENESGFIASYARNLEDECKKLKLLREQLKTLKRLTEEN